MTHSTGWARMVSFALNGDPESRRLCSCGMTAGGIERTHRRIGKGERYIKLPAGFWVNQWVVRLSGAAVAILLVLFDQHYLAMERPEFWVSPGRARDLYGLSRDTWTKGVWELARAGIVVVDRYPVNDDDFGWARLRNV